jgi:hypothetical protein
VSVAPDSLAGLDEEATGNTGESGEAALRLPTFETLTQTVVAEQ